MSPYVPEEDRRALRHREPRTSGELNYAITRLVLDFLSDLPSYMEYNEVIGALECAKLELYRRRIAQYEDRKKEENGEVY